MKTLFFSLTLLLSAPLFADSHRLCSGEGLVRSTTLPLPVRREITVHVRGIHEQEGSLSAQAGGEPVFYEGTLTLDGSEIMETIFSESGNPVQLAAKLENSRLTFKMTFMNENNEVITTVGPAKLRCLDL